MFSISKTINRLFRLTTLALLLPLVLTSISTGVAQAGPNPSWYDTNWQYRKNIIIDHTKVDADLTDFPLLISLTSDSHLAANARPDGGDIRFTSSNATTLLPREIEYYSGGTLVAWVKTDLSSTADTVLYLYYGNALATEPAEDSIHGAQNVWDSNFKMVQHLQEDPTGSDPAFKDSTSNDNDGSNWGSMTSSDQVIGQVDGSIDFDGSNDRINIGDIGTLSNNTFSISVWVKVANASPRQEMVWGAVTGTWDERFRFEVYDTWINFHDVYNMDTYTSSGTIEADNCYHVVATYDYPNQEAYIYVDGVFEASDTSFSQAPSTLGALQIGSRDNWVYLDGVIDEVRISDIARSADWIKTCYNNQNSPSTFYTIGAEESANQAPYAPTSLGPAQYVNGSWGNDNTPTLQFTQSDPDAGDTVKYQIQIGDSDDFSSPVVDYTSALFAQGATNFTIGQAAGGGSYVAGGEGQPLTDGSYYWQVMSTDNQGAASGWTTANGGAIAFKVDTTPPPDASSVTSTSHTPNTWSNDNTIDVTWVDATDTGSGLDGYSTLWDTSPTTIPPQTKDTEEGIEATTSPALADGSSHYFHIRSADNAGNWQATVHLGPFFIDTSPPTDPTNVQSTSHTPSTWSNDNTIDITWTDATDTGSGLDGYSIIWDTNSNTIPDTTKDIEEGVRATTSPALADGSSHYFHIRSVDNAGNWQSTVHLGPFFINTSPPTEDDAPTRGLLTIHLEGTIHEARITLQGILLEGLTVSSPDGLFVLKIRSGTQLTIDGEIVDRIEIQKVSQPPPPPPNCKIISDVYEVIPSGISFEPPAILVMAFDPDKLPENSTSLTMAYYTPEEGWVELESEGEAELGTMTAPIAHSSIFAILVKCTPPAAPATFSVTHLFLTPAEVELGEQVTINISIANTGGTEGTYAVILKINGVKEAEKSIKLAPGETQDVSFSVTREAAGSYDVAVDGLSRSFSALAPPPPPMPAPPTPPPPAEQAGLLVGAAIAIMVVAVGFLILFLIKRRRY